MFVEYCKEAGFIPLNLCDKHVLCANTLCRPDDAPRHSDPFDRLLLAQAKSENLAFLTHDSLIPGYGEKCVVSV